MPHNFHEANRRRWEVGSASWARRADTRGIWQRCHRDPSLALSAAELNWFGDIAGKNVAVLGSGDNQVVFALAGLGAKVTSVDISEQQLEVARRRAAELGLQVDFVRGDVVHLSALGDGRYDVVHTGGHVAVWVSDLRRYYTEAARILKPAGRLIVSEYHPFRRVWKGRHTILKSASTTLIADLTVQRSRRTYCTPSRVTWSNSSSAGPSPTTFPPFSLRGVSSSTSRNWTMPAKAGKARQWLGFRPPFSWLVVEAVRPKFPEA